MKNLLLHIAQSLPAVEGSTAPEWIQLLPSGTFTGADGRGPFSADDLQSIINATGGRKLPIDENHSTDHLATQGKAAPARGWIVEMQARPDGIWGRVEWTEEGNDLVVKRSYGFISPVVMHAKSKPHRITEIMRAALTNDPNFTSLKSLHGRNTHMDKETLALLGLKDDADDAAIQAAITSLNAANKEFGETLVAVNKALELGEKTTAKDIVAAINAKGDKSGNSDKDETEVVVALQEQVKELAGKLNGVSLNAARQNAETIIGQAVVGLKITAALKDTYIARHMNDPAAVEAEIALMPSINAGGLGNKTLDLKDGKKLDSDAAGVCAMMGLDPEAFAKTQSELTTEAL